MLRYLFKFTIRSFRSNRSFFLFSISGLSLSLTAFLVINNYVAFEKSYDRHHAEYQNIFRVGRFYGGGTPTTYANCFAAVGPQAAATIPEVSEFGRVVISDKVLSHFSLSMLGDDGLVTALNQEQTYFADQGIAEFFIHDWVERSTKDVLTEPFQMLISQSVARKFFGEQPALGRSMRLNGQESYTITGVFNDLPRNTHLPIQVLCSMASLPSDWNLDNEWGWGNFHTYVKSDHPQGLSDKIHQMAANHLSPDHGLPDEFLLQPLASIHLHSEMRHEIRANGSASQVGFLELVAWLILAIGWINYVNLHTARSVEISKSVILKKVIGSSRQIILAQLLFEASFLALLASAIALTASQLLAPVVYNQFGTPSLLSLGSQLGHVAIFYGGLLLVSLYPIHRLAGVPVRQLTQNGQSRFVGVSLRKVLVVFQFSITTLLIISTVVVEDQRRFMLGSNTGFEKEQVLAVTTPATVEGNHEAELGRLADALGGEAGVRHVGLTAHLPGYEVTRMRSLYLKGGDREDRSYPRVISADAGFFRSLDFELLDGRYFDTRFNDEFSLVLNEATLLDLGLESPAEAIGRKVIMQDEEYEIVGVMKNYHQLSLRSKFQPIVFVNSPRLFQYYAIALEAGTLNEQLERIGNEFAALYPNDHFDYFFLDTYFDQQYNRDIAFGRLTGTFSGLAIAIALFGLAGLTMFSVSQRVKEIGIRKVLGARWVQLVMLFNGSFMKLIGASFIFGVPAAYFLMDLWLSEYAYRVTLGILHFVVPMIAVLLIAALIIVTIVSRFVEVNPSETLRSE